MSPLGPRRFVLISLITVLSLTVFFIVSTHADHSHFKVLRSIQRANSPTVLGLAPHRSLNANSSIQTSRGRPSHRLGEDGLLYVNLDASHPIYDLTARAEKEWRAKQAKASRSLHEAVAEYRRRYGRYPPKGFNLWWNFVSKYQVQLPDEYDQIMHDIQPLWGIGSPDIGRLRETTERLPETFTLLVTNGDVRIAANSASFSHLPLPMRLESSSRTANAWIEVIRPIARYLPDLRVTFSTTETPRSMIKHELRRSLLAAAGKGQVMNIAARNASSGRRGLHDACSQSSPFSQAHPTESAGTRSAWERSSKTFIHEHTKSMDSCLHPSHLHLHGFHHGYNNQSLELLDAPLPLLCASTTPVHWDVVVPPLSAWQVPARILYPQWNRKAHSKLFWRGTTTGMKDTALWMLTPRARFVEAMNERLGDVWVMPSTETTSEPVGWVGDRTEQALLNDQWTNVRFSGTCTAETAVCEEMAKRNLYAFDDKRGESKNSGENHFKFLMDLDGDGPSSRFKSLLRSKSLVLKSTLFTEWWTNRIQPWLHYVPIKVDYTDIYDTMAFFKGDIDGNGHDHDEMAATIARAGTKWDATHMRPEDATAYLFRLLLEYARVTHPNRETMNFAG